MGFADRLNKMKSAQEGADEKKKKEQEALEAANAEREAQKSELVKKREAASAELAETEQEASEARSANEEADKFAEEQGENLDAEAKAMIDVIKAEAGEVIQKAESLKAELAGLDAEIAALESGEGEATEEIESALGGDEQVSEKNTEVGKDEFEASILRVAEMTSEKNIGSVEGGVFEMSKDRYRDNPDESPYRQEAGRLEDPRNSSELDDFLDKVEKIKNKETMTSERITEAERALSTEAIGYAQGGLDFFIKNASVLQNLIAKPNKTLEEIQIVDSAKEEIQKALLSAEKALSVSREEFDELNEMAGVQIELEWGQERKKVERRVHRTDIQNPLMYRKRVLLKAGLMAEMLSADSENNPATKKLDTLISKNLDRKKMRAFIEKSLKSSSKEEVAVKAEGVLSKFFERTSDEKILENAGITSAEEGYVTPETLRSYRDNGVDEGHKIISEILESV